jgi:hypothetical protein
MSFMYYKWGQTWVLNNYRYTKVCNSKPQILLVIEGIVNVRNRHGRHQMA